jgi:hypothetical protein
LNQKNVFYYRKAEITDFTSARVNFELENGPVCQLGGLFSTAKIFIRNFFFFFYLVNDGILPGFDLNSALVTPKMYKISSARLIKFKLLEYHQGPNKKKEKFCSMR